MEFEKQKVLTFKDVEKASELVGKNVAYGDHLDTIKHNVNDGYSDVLTEIDDDDCFEDSPFVVNGCHWRYVYPAEQSSSPDVTPESKGIRNGDFVKVFRTFEAYEEKYGMDDETVESMVGKVYEVKDIHGKCCDIGGYSINCVIIEKCDYNESQKRFVEENDIRAGSMVKLTREWDCDEGGFIIGVGAVLEDVGKVTEVIGIRNDSIMVRMSKCPNEHWDVPYFVLEPVSHIPFIGREITEKHGTCVVSKKDPDMMYTITGTNSSSYGMNFLIGGKWLSAEECLSDFTLCDGYPFGKAV